MSFVRAGRNLKREQSTFLNHILLLILFKSECVDLCQSDLIVLSIRPRTDPQSEHFQLRIQRHDKVYNAIATVFSYPTGVHKAQEWEFKF